MIKQINRYTFHDEFQAIRPDNFSYDGLSVLFDYLEEYEDSTGQQIELDVIALCCDYAEDSPEDLAAQYDIDTEGLDEEEVAEAVLEYLNDHTSVCGVTKSGTIVYCSAF